MCTDTQLHAGFEHIMSHMLKAGWLRSFTFTEGRGFQLEWTEAGTDRAKSLMTIIKAFGLSRDDRGPLAFDRLAHGEPLPSGVRAVRQLDPEQAAAWRQCVEELGIERTEDPLLFLVHVVLGWAPGPDMPLKFGP